MVNPACADATPQQPVCGGLLLPNGAKGRVLLSQGKCGDITDCLGSPDAALLVNGKANLQNTDGSKLYTRSKPATLVLKCDKTLCGGGNNNTFPVTSTWTATTRVRRRAPVPGQGPCGRRPDVLLRHPAEHP